MANIDMVTAKVENLRENYKSLIQFLIIILTGTGAMIYTAVDKRNFGFVILAALLYGIATVIGVLTRKAWIDLERKTEELKDV